MSVGALIRDLRLARGWTQLQLAEALGAVSGRDDGSPDVTAVKRWERGRVIPQRYWLGNIAHVLDVPLPALTTEATLSRMDRRAFLSLTALTATHGKAATELVCSVAGGDAGPLTTIQTTHGTDLIIASLADKTALRYLRGWMGGAANPVLRVNAAGILAKLPDQSPAVDVAQILRHDADVRSLYSTAVVARSCAVEWASAARLVADPLAAPQRAAYVARRLTEEVVNPRDAGARWCAASMLRDLSPLLGR